MWIVLAVIVLAGAALMFVPQLKPYRLRLGAVLAAAVAAGAALIAEWWTS